MLKIKNNVGGSGGAASGQYVWGKYESVNGPIIGYVIGETVDKYPNGAWSDGVYYKILRISFKVNNTSYSINIGTTWDYIISHGYSYLSVDSDGYVCYNNMKIMDGDRNYIKSSDYIMSNYTYITTSGGGAN